MPKKQHRTRTKARADIVWDRAFTLKELAALGTLLRRYRKSLDDVARARLYALEFEIVMLVNHLAQQSNPDEPLAPLPRHEPFDL